MFKIERKEVKVNRKMNAFKISDMEAARLARDAKPNAPVDPKES